MAQLPEATKRVTRSSAWTWADDFVVLFVARPSNQDEVDCDTSGCVVLCPLFDTATELCNEAVLAKVAVDFEWSTDY